MARSVDGVSNWITIAADMSTHRVLDMAFWMYIPTAWPTPGPASALTYIRSDGASINAAYFWANNGSNLCAMLFSDPSGHFYEFSFPQPSVNVWHHYLMEWEMFTLQCQAWVDGVAQTMTPVLAQPGSYGTFGNWAVYLGKRGATGGQATTAKFAEFAMWGGGIASVSPPTYENNDKIAKALFAGGCPLQGNPDNLDIYTPLYGHDSPEVTLSKNYTPGGSPLGIPSPVLTGSCPIFQHPPVRGIVF